MGIDTLINIFVAIMLFEMMVSLGLSSAALAIAPLQDALNLGSDALNVPSSRRQLALELHRSHVVGTCFPIAVRSDGKIAPLG
jgi:hypothetical protein